MQSSGFKHIEKMPFIHSVENKQANKKQQATTTAAVVTNDLDHKNDKSPFPLIRMKCSMFFAICNLLLLILRFGWLYAVTLNLTFYRLLHPASLPLTRSLARLFRFKTSSQIAFNDFCAQMQENLDFFHEWIHLCMLWCVIAKGLAKFFVLPKLIILKYWWYDVYERVTHTLNVHWVGKKTLHPKRYIWSNTSNVL